MKKLGITGAQVAVWIAGLSATGWAQEAVDQAAGGLHPAKIVIPVVVVVLILVGAVWFFRQQSDSYHLTRFQPDSVSTPFDPMMAELQSIEFRLKSDTGKGYFIKLDRLARIYLERIGVEGAKEMDEEALKATLASGEVSGERANVLHAIFEQCAIGAAQGEVPGKTQAADVAADLRRLVERSSQQVVASKTED